MLARHRLKRPREGGFARVPEARLSKAPLIAIVDDDQFFRESMRRLMRSLGYPVEAFPSAGDFLASRRLDETACLIADIQMPGMTGVELYARLIETGQKIPTILVTAYPDEATQARALKDGIVGYLLKPFDDNDLVDCVRKAVAGGKPPLENS
jgi:FixJ family two-component response regulator